MLNKVLLTTTLVLGFAASAGAVQVSIGGCVNGSVIGYGATTCVANATVYDFNSSSALPANFTGSGVVKAGTTSLWATPASDTSSYLAVASTTPVGSETITLGAVDNYFGLLWGSIDTYNSVQFLLNGNVVATVGGSSVLASGTPSGNQFDPGSNEYVNFTVAGGFNEVKLNTTSYNFEVDNLAFANVPEPGMFGLFGVGLVALFVRRRVR